MIPQLYKPQLPVHVPDEMWYRFEDRRYSVTIDAELEIYGSRLDVELREYYVHHHTPKGVWLTLFRSKGLPFKDYWSRFVLKSATRKFACPTIELAKESFIARKRKQSSIYRDRAAQADRAIDIVKERKWP